jgi:hypothetical protein
LCLLFVGCVSVSDIQPIGNGRYMITGRASGGLNAGKETAEAEKKANAYCAAQNKSMVMQNLNQTGNAAVFGESINFTFTCENK